MSYQHYIISHYTPDEALNVHLQNGSIITQCRALGVKLHWILSYHVVYFTMLYTQALV